MALFEDQQGNTEGLHETTRGPWQDGYASSVEPFMVGVTQIVGDVNGEDLNSSRNVVLDPFTGAVVRRTGCSIQNDTVTTIGGFGGAEDTGLLESQWSAKARQLFALDSPSLADGFPTTAVLYGNDSDKKGTIYAASTNPDATTNPLRNYSLLEDFSDGNTYSNNPATDTGSSKYRMKVVPTFVDSGAGLYNRGAYPIHRQYLTSGSRSILQNQNWVYAPNLYGNPFRWNKRFNESGTVGSETVRVFPTGPWQPLFPPTVETGTVVTSSGNWLEGDSFYCSVLYQFEDGSYSAPLIPRAPNDILNGASGVSNGLGFVSIGTPTGSTQYKHLLWRNIPIGPAGTIARILLRTPKQHLTKSSDTLTITPLDLRIVAVINNNRETTYYDYAGDDNSLVEDADVVRLDYVLPRRSRYIGTGDQRAVISHTLPNQSAIMLTPIHNAASSAADYAYNLTDNSDALYSATAYYFRVVYSDRAIAPGLFFPSIRLYRVTASGPATSGTDYVSYGTGTVATLDQLVDYINSTKTSLALYSVCGKWAAQLAPGVDGSLSLFSLSPTCLEVQSVLATNGSSVVTVSSQTAADMIPIGAMFSNQNSGLASTFAAGTYVVSKSGTSITLSAPSSSTVTRHSSFSSDTGDEGYITYDSNETYGARVGGFVRCFGSSFPGVIYMKPYEFDTSNSYFSTTALTPDRTSVYFTLSSPGETKSGTSLAPNAWVSGNRRMPHSSPNQRLQRACVGIVDIEGAAIVAYTDGIYILANQRGANTGEDEDTRLFTVNDTRGCISYRGIVSGHGWAAYATLDGIVVTDKSRREYNISKSIYNRSTLSGDLYYEITKSSASAAADTDDQYFVLSVLGSKLAVAFRYQQIFEELGIPTYADASKVIYYDFSQGIEASGIDELVGEGLSKVYGWSAPCVYNFNHTNHVIGAMGSVFKTTLNDYIAVDSNAGSTGDGRIDQINTGVLDNGFAYTAVAVMPPLLPSDFALLKPQVIEATHYTPDGSGLQTRLEFSNTQDPSFSSVLARKIVSDTTAKPRFYKQVIPIDSTQRVVTDSFWMKWTSETWQNKLWRVVLRYAEVKNPNSRVAGY
jgi:hypothetical protein